jgi:8-oxo-dGTP diphosphatase
MAGPFVYEYPRPSVTVDCVVFAFDGEALRTLLIRRKNEPFARAWAIPGGFLEMDEEFAAGALRELREETGLGEVSGLCEIGTFGKVGRDPRGRTITVAHMGVVRWPCPIAAGDDAADAVWCRVDESRDYAFDHEGILCGVALHRLAASVYLGKPEAFVLLPDPFDGATLGRLLGALSSQLEGTAYPGLDALLHRWRAKGRVVEVGQDLYRGS